MAVFSLEQAGVDLPEIVHEIQPQQLRIVDPAIVLYKVFAIGILILDMAFEDIVDAKGEGHLIFEECLLYAQVHLIK
jgi:hypothetical protein